MSIVMNMTWAEITADDYDRLEAEVGWRREPPAGGRYHLSWFTDTGVRIVDVWDSAETFNAFTQQRLMPGVAAVGLAGEPQIDIWPLYDLQIEGDPPRGCVVSDGMSTGMPKALYQSVERALDWHANAPADAFVHIAALDGETIRDVGVWASAAAIEAFVTGPVAATLADLDAGDDAADSADAQREPVHELYRWFDPTRVNASA